MTATDTPTEVAIVHVTSSPMTVKRYPLDNHHTPTCVICGPLGEPMHKFDAADVRRRHEHDVAVAAIDDTAGEEE